MYLPAPAPAEPGAAPVVRRAVVARRATVETPSGRLLASFPMRDRDYLVRRMVVQGPASTIARIYVGEVTDLNLADATANGASDIADNVQPLYVPGATPLYVVWTSSAGGNVTDPDGVAMARIEIEET